MTLCLLPFPRIHAQELVLPVPGTMVALSPAFEAPVLKGLKVHPEDPFRFDFIIDPGMNAGTQVKEESAKLIKYFLASLTTPEKELWVNLSPYEKERIVPQSFGQTEMGRDLLAQDYILKQLTASLVYPEGEIGKRFWKRVYEISANKNVPVNTFNKVWIVPGKAVVYENAKAGTAYVVESSLKVMTEQDYLATSTNEATGPAAASPVSSSRSPLPAGRQASPGGVADTKMTFPLALRSKQADAASPVAGISQVVRETEGSLQSNKVLQDIVIPQLTKEVNEGQSFTQLRQVYNALILATWYKQKIKDSILTRVYADKNKIKGTEYADALNAQAIYQRYLQAFKKGAYNYIKEEQDPVSLQMIPRKYFSGGFDLAMTSLMEVEQNLDQAMLDRISRTALMEVKVQLDRAQTSPEIKDFIEHELTDFVRMRVKAGVNEDLSLVGDLIRKAVGIDIQLADHLEKVLSAKRIEAATDWIVMLNEEFFARRDIGYYLSGAEQEGKMFVNVQKIVGRKILKLRGRSETNEVLHLRSIPQDGYPISNAGHYRPGSKYAVVSDDQIDFKVQRIKASLERGTSYVGKVADPQKEKYRSESAVIARSIIRAAFEGKSDAEIVDVIDLNFELHELQHLEAFENGARNRFESDPLGKGQINNETLSELTSLGEGKKQKFQLLNLFALLFNPGGYAPSLDVLNRLALFLGIPDVKEAVDLETAWALFRKMIVNYSDVDIQRASRKAYDELSKAFNAGGITKGVVAVLLADKAQISKPALALGAVLFAEISGGIYWWNSYQAEMDAIKNRQGVTLAAPNPFYDRMAQAMERTRLAAAQAPFITLTGLNVPTTKQVVPIKMDEFIKKRDAFLAARVLGFLKSGNTRFYDRKDELFREFSEMNGLSDAEQGMKVEWDHTFFNVSNQTVNIAQENPVFQSTVDTTYKFLKEKGLLDQVNNLEALNALIVLMRHVKSESDQMLFSEALQAGWLKLEQYFQSEFVNLTTAAKLHLLDLTFAQNYSVESVVGNPHAYVLVNQLFARVGEDFIHSMQAIEMVRMVAENRVSVELFQNYARFARTFNQDVSFEEIFRILLETLKKHKITAISFFDNNGIFYAGREQYNLGPEIATELKRKYASDSAQVAGDMALAVLRGVYAEGKTAVDVAPAVKPKNTGGIDFNADKMDLETRNQGGAITFKVDPAQLKELQDAPGFAAVIINVAPLKDLRMFLGI